MWQKPCRRTSKLQENPYLLAALVHWDAIRFQSLPKFSRFTNFFYQDWFQAGCNNLTPQTWKQKKITRLMDLVHNNRLMEKEQLESVLDLRLSWLAYSQIKSMASYVHLKEIIKCPMTSFEDIIAKALNSKKQLIASLYRFLNTPGDSDFTTYQKNWRHLINVPLDCTY